MKHFYKLSLLAFFFVLSENAGAQQLQNLSIQNSKKDIRCYTVEVINDFRRLHPGAETDAQFESVMSKKILARKAQRVQAVNYTIPVIFHIINNGEAIGTSPNLSAAVINQQLLQLNKDYANLSNSQYAVSANTGIQFVLAQKNPGGSVLGEQGIERIDRNTFGWTDYSTSSWTTNYIDGTVKPASIWDATQYYNVWIIPGITNGTSNLLGYATFPTLSTLPDLASSETATTAGVVVATSTIGSSFSPAVCGYSYGLGKTLSHETGHFLGLRHIWGDAVCGEDYCNDTPVHYQSNSGVPTHPKSNSCGTADEMFENYMDYTDDVVLNTFTANQVDRMQTVMLNSPRRVSLATSSAGSVAATGSNKISFINCSGTLNIPEAGTTGTYPRYRDVDLTLNVEDKATGAATVNITATGTAVYNFHYQLLTPSLTFASGDNFKDVKIRVFDNAEVDGNKTIILNYSIAGTGVTAGSTAQSVTINVIDDDNLKFGTNIVSIYSENFGITNDPFSGWLTGSFISPAGPNKWILGSNGGANVTGRALYITNDVTNKPLDYTLNQASDAVAITPSISTIGYTNPTLSFLYKSDGEAGLDYGTLMYSFNNTTFTFLTDGSGNKYTYQNQPTALNSGNILLPSQLQGTSFSLGFRWLNNDNGGVAPPFLIDDISITGLPYPIETTVSNTYGYDIRSGSAINNFESTNKKIIAAFKNLSTSLTDVTAQITQVGSGTAVLTTSGGSYLRTQKVFQISPAAANTTVTYQATFYFTEAELATWGTNRLSLKILKVKDGVDLNSTLNANNAELITPTVLEDAAAGYIAYTGNFTGFSQFILVSPTTVLPVTLTNFTVKPIQKNIELKWSTSLEINNRGFIVERSTDALHFKQIGWVNGNGTTSLVSNYNFTDPYVQPNIVYYYRIRQVDIDNRELYSEIRNARISQAAGIVITVSPNPAKDFINLFITGTSNKASIELINSTGQQIKQKDEVNAFDGVYKLALGNIAKGTYHVIVHLPEGSFTKKIIVE